jgi:hypothetical protein
MINLNTTKFDFSSAYFELCNKESDTVVIQNDHSILGKKITYIKEVKSEFLFIESEYFEQIGVDSVSLELDDLFGTYNVMLGVKLQKKYSSTLRSILNNELKEEEPMFSLLFNSDDGLWDLNFPLNNVEGFSEQLEISDAIILIYNFMKNLVCKVKSAS